MSDATTPASSATAPSAAAADGGGDPGPCLCLSGGGFRATLFHLGALIRLNELGVLSRMKVVTSVSGGSILNGVLATRWPELVPGPNGSFENFAVVVNAVRGFCARDLRTRVLIGSRLNPRYALTLARDLGAVPARALATAYSGLMRGTSLGRLPGPGAGVPRFVFCATNSDTGACWHFHGGPGARMGDFYTGYFDARDVTVAEAVAASSSFPPGFGGLELTLAAAPGRVDPWGRDRPPTNKPGRLVDPKAGRTVMLTDGGVYDNLGVEPVWDLCRTLVVSDAGHPFTTATNSWQAFVPRLMRAADIAAEQVGAVRKRWMIERIKQATDQPGLPGQPAVRSGTIWAIDTPPGNFPRMPEHRYDDAALALLANVRTDLNAFSDDEQMFLMNHGYWLADAGIRLHAEDLAGRLDAPFAWPGPACAPEGRRADEALGLSGKRRVLRDLARWVFRLDPKPASS